MDEEVAVWDSLEPPEEEPEEPTRTPFPVWEDNWTVLEVFLACQTQWRYAGMSGARVGMDYAGVRAAIEMMGLEADAGELFEGLRVMEYSARDVFREKEETRRRKQESQARLRAAQSGRH